MVERTVTIRLCKEFTELVPLHEKDFCDAIGRLASWSIASGRFLVVRIFGDAEGNMGADYFTDNEHAVNNMRGYEIFALRDEDGSYSLHS